MAAEVADASAPRRAGRVSSRCPGLDSECSEWRQIPPLLVTRRWMQSPHRSGDFICDCWLP